MPILIKQCYFNKIHSKINKLENISINNKNYPLGSMPREDNSFRNILLIQVANAESPSILACSSNCWRKSSESLNWYCVDLFSFLIDIVITSIYSTNHCNYSIIAFTKTNKALIVLPTPKEPLITHLLKRSKQMTDYNSTPYTAIGVSKIHSINGIHHKSDEYENISHTKAFTDLTLLGYSFLVVAKSTTEPGNSNNLDKANSSTPLNRAFFVRSTRTPKENVISIILSMVACNGKGSPFAVHLVEQFSSPLHVTAQTLESLAVAPNKSDKELSAMIYKFLLLGSQRLKITVRANNKAEALSKVKFNSKPLLIARLRNPIVNTSANMTACEGVQYA